LELKRTDQEHFKEVSLQVASLRTNCRGIFMYPYSCNIIVSYVYLKVKNETREKRKKKVRFSKKKKKKKKKV